VYDWANVSGDYDNPMDYRRLCRKCHRIQDGMSVRFSAGQLQEIAAAKRPLRQLARDFGVSRALLSLTRKRLGLPPLHDWARGHRKAKT
jgi:hypothetical protein